MDKQHHILDVVAYHLMVHCCCRRRLHRSNFRENYEEDKNLCERQIASTN